MRTKLIAALAMIITLMLGSSANAMATPQASTKSVTYSISIKSGSGLDSVIDYQAGYGKTWVITNAPWTKTVKLSQQSMPSVIARSRTRDGKWPTYVCSIRVNGVLKAQKEGYGGVQCYQGY